MKLKWTRNAVIGLAGLLAFTGLTACGSSDDDAGSDDKSLTIPIAAGWDEDIAVSHLWKYVLEEHGYSVKLPNLDVAPLFVGLADGEADIFFDTWLPNTHEDYWKQYGDDVIDVKVWYNGKATNHIAVPEYMDIDSIDELEEVGDEVDWQISGIDAGAGLMRLTKGALKEYGLDEAGYDLKTASTPAMLAALKKATDNKKPIVVPLWKPHWAYKAFPVKNLEDPKGAMGEGEEIHLITRKGFDEDHPDIFEALKNFEMDDDMLADLENTVLQEYEDNPQEGVKAWVKDNQEYVDGLMD